jgi:cytochrome b pre-mRNA-processing protein 3
MAGEAHLGMFWRKRDTDTARRLYVRIVAQAREPAFYTRLGVADSADGRFDMIALHAYLVLRRLKRDRAQSARLAQSLFDVFFADMDQNLRAMGVGDLSVGRTVKEMAKLFYGRVSAYDEGLVAGAGVLADALARNLYRGAGVETGAVEAMAGYVRREADALERQPLDPLLGGDVSFGRPPFAGKEESP